MTPPVDGDTQKMDLILRYLSDECDERQVEELSQLLRVDAATREELFQIAMQALAVSELASTSAGEAEDNILRTSQSDNVSAASMLKWTSYALACTVVCAVIAFGIRQFQSNGFQGLGTDPSRSGLLSDDSSNSNESRRNRVPNDSPKIPDLIRIIDSTGQILWKGTDGTVLKVSPSVTALGEGTIILETETSYLEVEFDDGTGAILKGISELAISGEQQKRLNLRKGNLVVEAVPQPSKQPLVVRTPNSENTVVGTRFELTVENGSTTLAVAEGKVQLRRLRDGMTVNVGKSEVVFVDEDTSDQQLRRSRFPTIPFSWSQSFEQMPSPSSWYGDWIPPDGKNPGLLRAVPRRVGENSENGMEYHYRISTLSASGPYVCVSPDSKLRLTFRTEQESRLELFISLKQMNRDFGGNFVYALDSTASNLTQLGNGWHAIEVPIRQMKAMSPKRPQVPSLAVLSFVYVSSLGKDIGLEVSGIEIFTPKTRSQ
jgi:ferric-dicitrate binding protein FerR (iron transport regulator)